MPEHEEAWLDILDTKKAKWKHYMIVKMAPISQLSTLCVNTLVISHPQVIFRKITFSFLAILGTVQMGELMGKTFDILKRCTLRTSYIPQFSNAVITQHFSPAYGGLARDPGTAELGCQPPGCTVPAR